MADFSRHGCNSVGDSRPELGRGDFIVNRSHNKRSGCRIVPAGKDNGQPDEAGSASVLVDGGIYRRTRNPMYLGFFVVLLGWAIFLSSLVAFLLLPAFIFYMNRFQLEPEEKALTATFGQPFIAYKTRVRRWL